MLKLSKGNHKIGKDTFIINITSAQKCPSAALGLCLLPSKCYAKKAERQYPAVLPYREGQTVLWDASTAVEMAGWISSLASRAQNQVRYLRFSEAGDFRNQEDVDKMSNLAELLEPHGIRVYGYTARKDLNYDNVHSNMVVNGSGFMVHNNFVAVLDPGDPGPSNLVCPGNCRSCTVCKERSLVTIKVRYH